MTGTDPSLTNYRALAATLDGYIQDRDWANAILTAGRLVSMHAALEASWSAAGRSFTMPPAPKTVEDILELRRVDNLVRGVNQTSWVRLRPL